jgi:predicted dithiol-disulfide oxidoreductase (DUF899 family)
MTIPTTVACEQEWNAQREALLVKEKALTGSWVRRTDEYTPGELAGGRT